MSSLEENIERRIDKKTFDIQTKLNAILVELKDKKKAELEEDEQDQNAANEMESV